MSNRVEQFPENADQQALLNHQNRQLDAIRAFGGSSPSRGNNTGPHIHACA